MSNDPHEADDLDMLLRLGLREGAQQRPHPGWSWLRLRSRILVRWRSQPAAPAYPYDIVRAPPHRHMVIQIDRLPEWHLFSLVQIAM